VIRSWLEALLAVDEQRERHVAAEKARIIAEHGGRFGGWTGGGSPDHNRIYDVETGETLLIIPDTLDAFETALSEHNWHTADHLGMEAMQAYAEPPSPPGYPEWLFTEDLDPDKIRAWLAEHPAT
jgi:hypothetical protein